MPRQTRGVRGEERMERADRKARRRGAALLAALVWVGAAGGPLEGTAAAGGAPAAAAAAVTPGRSVAPERLQLAAPADSLTIHLLTFGPGPAIWERFGHNAIWVSDAAAGTDIAYNYGIFDFDQENFFLRLMRGRMLYRMEPQPVDWMVWAYSGSDRTIVAQELALSPEEERALADFLAWNARPENKFYRYDYYRDNCSTRVRDALDRATGGVLRARLSGVPTGSTYRSHTQRLTAGELAVNTGLLLALGQPVDQRLSAWEEGFIPMELAEHVRAVTVAGPGGEPVPLVRAERVLHQAAAAPPAEAPDRTLGFAAAGLLLAALLVGLGAARRRGARALLLTASALWGVLYGLLGTVILALWLLTEHSFTYRNENVLQANPLGLLLAVLVPLALLGRPRLARPALAVAALAAGLSLVGALLQALPTFDQVNGAIVALALPLHAGVLGALLLALRPRG